jgi:hypothetical protein
MATIAAITKLSAVVIILFLAGYGLGAVLERL